VAQVSQAQKTCSECSKAIIGRSVRSSGTMVTYNGLFGKESTIIPGYAHPECASPRYLSAHVCDGCFILKPCGCGEY